MQTLYIEADEDHIHLQNGKAGMTKLIYVHEGKQTIKKGRNELKNLVYFSGIYQKEKIEDLWKQVWEYITNTYDEDKIKRIYISGDEAEWIKFGAKYLPNAIAGCSAESHVSHVLSERLSRGSIAWSKAGAHKMAQLRAIKASGIHLKDAVLKQQYEALKPIELPKQSCIKQNSNSKRFNQYMGP